MSSALSGSMCTIGTFSPVTSLFRPLAAASSCACKMSMLEESLSKPRRAMVPTQTAAEVAQALMRRSVWVAKGAYPPEAQMPRTPILSLSTSLRLIR